VKPVKIRNRIIKHHRYTKKGSKRENSHQEKESMEIQVKKNM